MVYKGKSIRILLLITFLSSSVFAQENGRLWTEADRNYLLDNLLRTKEEMIRETKDLTLAQWEFKEGDGKWSIAQVVEHLGLYERIVSAEKNVTLNTMPQPELIRVSRTDSAQLAWMGEEQAHTANDFSIPLGLMKGGDNLVFYQFGRDILIRFISETDKDLKAYYTFRKEPEKRRSLHSLFVVHFGHTDRHLRQIRRIKQHKNFPK
jgi:DinB superfamily